MEEGCALQRADRPGNSNNSTEFQGTLVFPQDALQEAEQKYCDHGFDSDLVNGHEGGAAGGVSWAQAAQHQLGLEQPQAGALGSGRILVGLREDPPLAHSRCLVAVRSRGEGPGSSWVA